MARTPQTNGPDDKIANVEHSAVVTPKIELQTMFLIDGTEKRMLRLEPLPFTVGRFAENTLVLTQPFVSRNHASITLEGGEFVLSDTGSRHGTYVNGTKVEKRVLSPHDRIQFGSLQAPVLVFGDEMPEQVTTQHDLLGKLQALTESTSELRKLRWLLDAARDLNDAGAVESVLASLIEATLALTKAERGYVLLADPDGELTLAAGRDSNGNRLEDAGSLSQTAIRRATESGSEFILTDTLSSGETPLSHSMVAQSLRTVICFPLLRRRDPARAARAGIGSHGSSILGVLYLDSRFVPGKLTGIDNDLLRTIAREAAALVENTALAAAEEQARQYREEMEIAAKIQKGLMAVQHPKLSFAGIEAMNVPCKEIGGDFFNVVTDGRSVSVALVDVSGKGISAALLASTLQGMLYMQLSSGQPLEEIAAVINSYLCTKDVGKYATMVLMRLHENGKLDFVNCGHIQPRVHSCGEVRRLEVSNTPVGLLPEMSYVSSQVQLHPGCRVLLVSDGVTEAENSEADMFGDERLDTSLASYQLNQLAASLWEFCGSEPLRDDCTMVELTYRG
jgi:serine phosphatase RsbU (regulator of sigma subunit)